MGPVTVAVTGPFACGKSTFVGLLGDLGAETVSADQIVHDLLAHDPETVSRIVERFGEEVRAEVGVDRRALGRRVFGRAEDLRDLENILHPLVRSEIDEWISDSEAPVFVAEIPLLFEGEGSDRFDFTVAVTAPEERRRSWSEGRGVSNEQRLAIEGRQLSGEEKARRADLVVENDAGLDKLRGQAEDIWRNISIERGSGNETPK